MTIIKTMDEAREMLMRKELESIRDRLQLMLSMKLQLAKCMAMLVEDDGSVNQDKFMKCAKDISVDNDAIRNISLSPDGVIRFIYPLEGNESALNYSIMDDVGTRWSIAKAIESRSSVSQGPVEAVQGGILVFTRMPVFIEKDGADVFWGLTSVALDFERLILDAGLREETDDYRFAMRSISAQYGSPNFLWGDQGLFDKPGAVCEVELPFMKWELAVAFK